MYLIASKVFLEYMLLLMLKVQRCKKYLRIKDVKRLKYQNTKYDRGPKELDDISNRSLSQPYWRNTYERTRMSHKSNYITMALVTNAHNCMHTEEYCIQQRRTNISCE